MVKKAPESKKKQAAKISGSSNKEKKKWSQGRSRDVTRRVVTVDRDLFAKIEKDISKASVVTSSLIAEKFNLNVGVAQKVLEHFSENKILQCLSATSKPKLYSKVHKVAAAEAVCHEDLPAKLE